MARNKSSEAAAEALKSYAIKTGTLPEGQLLGDNIDETETAMADLLADFQHLCDDFDLDFEQLLGRASGYYNDEV